MKRSGEFKVTKELIRKHPKIIEDFTKWYNEQENLPSINEFFEMSTFFTMAIWYNYFYACGIDISLGEDKTLIFYRTEPIDSVYPQLSGNREICHIIREATPFSRFEEAVAELIYIIDKPF